MPWKVQINDSAVDAIVACADPETTTKVALACAEAGKPVMATKPLMLTEMPQIRAPFYVDFWRLWGERWKVSKSLPGLYKDPFLSVHFFGNGPDRSFPGYLDYGPHAAAFLLDAFRSVFVRRSVIEDRGGGRSMLVAELNHGDRRIEFRVGNGASNGHRYISCGEDWKSCNDVGYRIWDEPVTMDKSSEIRAMCQSFLNEIHESYVSTYTLDLSVQGMRLLKQAEVMANDNR